MLQFPNVPQHVNPLDSMREILENSGIQEQNAAQRLANARAQMQNQQQQQVMPSSIAAQIAQNQATQKVSPSGADAQVAQNLLSQKTAALGPLFNTLRQAPSSPAFLKLASDQDPSLQPSYDATLNNLLSQSTRRNQLSSTQSWRGMTPLQKSQIQVAMAARGFTMPELQNMIQSGHIYDVYSSKMTPQQYETSFGTRQQPAPQQASAPAAQGSPASLSSLLGVINNPQPSAPAQAPESQPSSAPAKQQISPEAAQELDQAQSYNIKQTTDQPIRVQRSYINTAASLYNNMVPLVDTIKKYSGAKGNLNQIMSKVAASSGTDSKDYQDLLLFKQHLPLFANELRRGYGAQATDQETKALNSVIAGNTLTQTPAQTVALFNQLGGMLDEQRKVLNQSPAQSLNDPVLTKRVPVSKQKTETGGALKKGSDGIWSFN